MGKEMERQKEWEKDWKREKGRGVTERGREEERVKGKETE